MTVRREVKGMQLGLWLPVYGGWLRVKGCRLGPDFAFCSRLAARAEALGFDYIYASENLLNCVYGPEAEVAECWTFLSGIAARTSRIGLMAAIKPGFYPPLMAAQMAKGLDHISRGRFGLNLVSGWWREEFEQAGVDYLDHAGRYRRATEFTHCLKTIWRGQPHEFDGEYYHLRGNGLPGRMHASPHPPIWISGHSGKAVDLAATEGNVLFLNSQPRGELIDKIQQVRARAAREKRTLRVAVSVFVLLGESDAAAQAHYDSLIASRDQGLIERFRTIMGESGAETWAGLTDEQMVDSNCGFASNLIGSSETVAERLYELYQLGVDIVMCQFEDMRADTERFGQHVLPILRSAFRQAEDGAVSTLSPLPTVAANGGQHG